MSSLLSPEERALLARLSLRPRRRLQGLAAGALRSGRLGQGLLFAEHRPYVPGDDPRYVDWHAAARLGEPLVKLFEREDDLELVLLVDRSPSMRGRKALQARRLAAALGTLALQEQGRVRLAWLPALGSARPALHAGRGAPASLQEALERAPEGGAAGWSALRQPLAAGGLRRSLVVLLSDFHDGAEALPVLRRLRASGHEVLALHVVDGADVDLPLGTAVEAVDAESGARVEVDVTPALLEALREGWQRRQRGLARDCRQAGVELVRVPAAAPLAQVLSALGLCGLLGRA
ncbi:MAG: DUF58 domain-containing protein [Planctomycetia bacterium]